jgi:two-component system sensor histidine kinase VicK
VLVKKDGSTLWCAVTSILIQDAGETLGYTILEDISERKALEEKLQKAYDAQETVMHMVAHDLKNPIHNIKTLSSFLNKNVEELQTINLKLKSLTYISMIADACEKAYTIIQDLLFIGELESGKGSFEKETIDLKRFIEAQLPAYELNAQEKSITIHFHSPAEQVNAQINPEKLARVLDNLLSNAIKFTKDGGQISLSLQPKAQNIVLQVRDNGIGIPEKLQGSVFNRFTKANRQGTQGEETTGLGLFIVKHIVELHQGKIWLESQENEGTCFYVELPIG